MIRVLHILHKMNYGGMETFLMNIYRRIDRSKVQFDFLLHSNEKCDFNDEIIELGGKIFHVPPRNKGLINNRKYLEDFFRENSHYQIVHQHVSSLSYVTPLKLARKYGIPTRIIHSHNTREGGYSFFHYLLHYFNKLIVGSFATDFLTCSILAAEWLFPKMILNGDRFKVIKNGIEVNEFKFDEIVRKQMRSKLNINNKLVIGHIGRFHPQKNHEFIIDVFNSIHKKNESTVLILIGDGPQKKLIQDKVKKMGLAEKVIFAGVRADVSKVIQAFDVFLFPSHYEGLGIVLIEAQASGLRCFTSRGVVPDEANVTGLVNFLDLNQTADYWASKILESSNYNRENTLNQIRSSGYDINKGAEALQEWYIQQAELAKR